MAGGAEGEGEEGEREVEVGERREGVKFASRTFAPFLLLVVLHQALPAVLGEPSSKSREKEGAERRSKKGDGRRSRSRPADSPCFEFPLSCFSAPFEIFRLNERFSTRASRAAKKKRR